MYDQKLLLVVYFFVLHIRGLVAARCCTGVAGTRLAPGLRTRLGASLIHFRSSGLPRCVQRVHRIVDGRQILALVSLPEFFQSPVYRALIAVREFFTLLLQLLFGLEDQRIGLVDFLNPLLRFLIRLGIGLGLLLHLLNFGIG